MSTTIEEITSGDRRALAKAITLIESQLSDDINASKKLLTDCLPHSGSAIRVAVTGVPGVGKSTFIEALGLHLVSAGKKVAVLAVDPTSPVSGGSLMGDKTRMEELSRSDLAFIRPSPTAGALGGVAYKTREAMLLCEAAGFDVVLIETVGVGQSEYEVANIVDLVLLLMLPNAGDELQGIKKGIMEICDFLVVNKSDGDFLEAAKSAAAQYKTALHLLGSTADTLTCSSLERTNIELIWSSLESSWQQLSSSGKLKELRRVQRKKWFNELVRQRIIQYIQSKDEAKRVWDENVNQIASNKVTPIEAAEQVVAQLFED